MTQEEYQALQEQRQLDEIRSLLWTSQAPLDQQNLRALGGPPTVPPRLQTPMTLDQTPQPADMGQFTPSSPGLDMNMDTPIQRGANRRGALDMAMVNEGTLHQPAPMSGPEQDAWDLTQFYRGLPAELRVATVEGGAPTLLSVFGAKRQQAALEAAKMDEQRRQHADTQILGIWRDDKLPLSQKKKLSEEMGRRTGNALGMNLAKMANDDLLGKAELYQQYLPKGKYEELVQILHTPNADLTPVEQWFKYAEEKHKTSADARFKSERFSDLIQRNAQTPFTPDSPEFDELTQLVQERKKKQEEMAKLQLDIKALQADLDFKQNAPREVASGISGEKGEVVTKIYNPKTKQVEEMRGIPLQRTQDMSQVERKETAEERAVLQQIATLDKLYSNDFVGPIDNMLAWAKETAPGVFGPIPENEERFRKTLNQIVTLARRLDVGTAQSVQELAQLTKTYPDLSQHESVYKPALEAMRERITAKLTARNRLAAEIRAGSREPIALSERAAQLGTLVSSPGFAKTKEEAKRIAQEILREEMALGIVKAD